MVKYLHDYVLIYIYFSFFFFAVHSHLSDESLSGHLRHQRRLRFHVLLALELVTLEPLELVTQPVEEVVGCVGEGVRGGEEECEKDCDELV